MGKENVEEFGYAIRDEPQELLGFMEHHAEIGREQGIQAQFDPMGELLPPVDRALLTGELAAHFERSNEMAFANGVWGWFDDDFAFVRPWGFELDAIAHPVALWQGRVDMMVPFAHGRRLAKHAPIASVNLLEDHGHLSISVGLYPTVLDDLIALGA
jgi:pimeloyl-ACP methyl ester carboxylesterase